MEETCKSLDVTKSSMRNWSRRTGRTGTGDTKRQRSYHPENAGKAESGKQVHLLQEQIRSAVQKEEQYQRKVKTLQADYAKKQRKSRDIWRKKGKIGKNSAGMRAYRSGDPVGI